MFYGGDAISIDESHWNPFAADDRKNRILDKQITKLKVLQSISRHELFQTLVANAYGFAVFTGMVSLAVSGMKFLTDGLLSGKDNSGAAGDINSLHPNVSKFLKPNTTINSYELEILQVRLLMVMVMLISYC